MQSQMTVVMRLLRPIGKGLWLARSLEARVTVTYKRITIQPTNPAEWYSLVLSFLMTHTCEDTGLDLVPFISLSDHINWVNRVSYTVPTLTSIEGLENSAAACIP